MGLHPLGDLLLVRSSIMLSAHRRIPPRHVLVACLVAGIPALREDRFVCSHLMGHDALGRRRGGAFDFLVQIAIA